MRFLLLEIVQCASCCWRWCNAIIVVRVGAMCFLLLEVVQCDYCC